MASDYKWHPIEPLSDADRAIDLSEIRPLLESWKETKDRLPGLPAFTEQLIRSLDIETGILEHLYTLDRGTTETLILKGFQEDLISRESTNIEPALLVDILRDHQAAAQMVMDAVAGSRELTKGFIHEIHDVLTRHQETAKGFDQFGKVIGVPLLRGAFKVRPNNPTRPDFSTYEYCPPVQVDSEMETLLTWFHTYDADDRLLVAAWLHHRFTQIHPYQDGNGRVARALVLLVLLKGDLLPVVVDRTARPDYIGALEKADAGNLAVLVQLFARLEKTAVLRAIGLQKAPSKAAQVIESALEELRRRDALRKVNDVAEAILERAQQQVGNELRSLDARFAARIDYTRNPGAPHWIVESAKEVAGAINLFESPRGLVTTIHVEGVELKFSVFFFHVGTELTGFMEASAHVDLDEGKRPRRAFRPNIDSFGISWKTSPKDVEAAFAIWLDRTLAITFKAWLDHL